MGIRIKVETPNNALGRLMAMDWIGFPVAVAAYLGPIFLVGIVATQTGGGILWAALYGIASIGWVFLLWTRGYRVWVFAFGFFGPLLPLALVAGFLSLALLPSIVSPTPRANGVALDSVEKIVEAHKRAIAAGVAYLPQAGSRSCPSAFPIKVESDYYLSPAASVYERSTVDVCYAYGAAQQYGFRSSPANDFTVRPTPRP